MQNYYTSLDFGRIPSRTSIKNLKLSVNIPMYEDIVLSLLTKGRELNAPLTVQDSFKKLETHVYANKKKVIDIPRDIDFNLQNLTFADRFSKMLHQRNLKQNYHAFIDPLLMDTFRPLLNAIMYGTPSSTDILQSQSRILRYRTQKPSIIQIVDPFPETYPWQDL